MPTSPNHAPFRTFLTLDDASLLAQCEVHTYRASGPGGQKRNKTSSAVRLHHLPTNLTTHADETRSQHQNKAGALKRLRMKIAIERPDVIDKDHTFCSTDKLEDRIHSDRPFSGTPEGRRDIEVHNPQPRDSSVRMHYQPSPELAICINEGRLQISSRNLAFPLVVHEIISLLSTLEGQTKPLADLLGITPSNLVRFLKSDPHIQRATNQIRKSHGHLPLK